MIPKADIRAEVVLVRPRDIGAVPLGAPVQDPLGIGYLTSVLRNKGYKIEVIDAHALDLNDKEVVECILSINPYIVGISLHSFTDYKHCLEISQGIKGSGMLCVWGVSMLLTMLKLFWQNIVLLML